jgi:hypothetical protein
MANCTHCGKPIILVPSAKERAEKFGGRPEDYTSQFTIHPECQIEKRKKETSELIARQYS